MQHSRPIVDQAALIIVDESLVPKLAQRTGNDVVSHPAEVHRVEHWDQRQWVIGLHRPAVDDDALKLEPDGADYLGNAARARLRRGEKGPEVRELLSKLIERDARQEWVTWAKERLALIHKASEN